MTSRQRVMAAMNHQEPDRIPVDFSGHRSSGIAALLYPKLRDYLGLPERPVRIYDPIQQLAIVDDDVLDLFCVDTIELGRGFALMDDDWADWILPDGTPCKMPAWIQTERENDRWIIRAKTGKIIAQLKDGSLYFEQTYYPFLEGDDLKSINAAMDESMWCALASPPGPVADGPMGDIVIREGARKLRESTDRAVLGLFGGNLFEMGQFLYRNDNFLLLLAMDPVKIHKFLDRIVEIHLKNLERFLSLVGEYIDVIVFGDDLGMQSGPQISPEMYREFFKPRHKILWDRARSLAGIKVMLHCCGGVRELLPDLIDAGLDAINPVQISSRGMDAGELKTEYGKDIVFWGGGCDTQRILPLGTPDEIQNHVWAQMSAFKPKGGFVFQQVHNILANVPPENVVTMFDAVKIFNERSERH